jgi:hypothetical protein
MWRKISLCKFLIPHGRQTNLSLNNEKSADENDEPTCSLKTIPLKCTPINQLCDEYFYRQVKNYTEKFQDCPVLIAANCKLSTRDDYTKMHAFIHHQLPASVYRNMTRYARYAAKLTTHEVFCNINQVTFLTEVKTEKCECGKQALIRCSWCQKFSCFCCIYNKYHPKSCTPVTLIWCVKKCHIEKTTKLPLFLNVNKERRKTINK